MWYEGVRSAHIMSITVKKYVRLESPLYPIKMDTVGGLFGFTLMGLNHHFLPSKILNPRGTIQILFIFSSTQETCLGKSDKSSKAF